MIATQSLLLTGLIALLIYTSVTDCIQGTIKNQAIVISGAIAITLDIVYYTVWGRQYLHLFFSNIIFLGVIVLLFYAYHLWAGGDSKLLFVVGLFIPANFYEGIFSRFIILILSFSAAIFYVVGETIVFGIKQHSLFSKPHFQMDYSRFVFSYIFMAGATMLCNWLLMYCLQNTEWQSLTLYTAMDFIIVLSLIQVRNRLSKRRLGIAAVGIAIMVVVLSLVTDVHINNQVNLFSCIFVFGLICIRSTAERYNYQIIPTSEVRKGQILAASTVISFSKSKVQGLPRVLTEDLRARLTQEEVNSIYRWEKTKYGKPYIMIVRKIPFAIFIAIGTILFLILRIFVL